jgi:hypothetical protein
MTNSNHDGHLPFRRPTPLLGPVEKPGEDQRLQEMPDPAGANSGAQVDAAASGDPYDAYPLSVTDIRSKLFALGISKSRDSIQRYCREGMLDCVKLVNRRPKLTPYRRPILTPCL